jgi:hypothetical protein
MHVEYIKLGGDENIINLSYDEKKSINTALNNEMVQLYWDNIFANDSIILRFW